MPYLLPINEQASESMVKTASKSQAVKNPTPRGQKRQATQSTTDDLLTSNPTTADQSAPSVASYPLFFKDPRPLSLDEHSHAGLKPTHNVWFSQATNSIPIHQYEFAEIARSYPIVLTEGDAPQALAVVGLGKTNIFVQDNGHWRAGHYVPAYVRKYPFALLELADQERFVLCIDQAADNFMTKKPEMPFYKDDGSASDVSKHALDFCGQYQKCHRATLEFTSALRDAGLLQSKEIQGKSAEGKELRLGGFVGINDAAWSQLSDKVYLEWRTRGWVDLVMLILMSQLNWKYLLPLGND